MSNTSKKTKDARSSAEESFSEGLEDLRQIEKECTTATRRVVSSLLSSIESWEKKREEASAEKTDGDPEEEFENMQQSLSSTLKESMDIHLDLMGSLNKIVSKKNPFRR